jgi:hypothetical protein
MDFDVVGEEKETSCALRKLFVLALLSSCIFDMCVCQQVFTNRITEWNQQFSALSLRLFIMSCQEGVTD